MHVWPQRSAASDLEVNYVTSLHRRDNGTVHRCRVRLLTYLPDVSHKYMYRRTSGVKITPDGLPYTLPLGGEVDII